MSPRIAAHLLRWTAVHGHTDTCASAGDLPIGMLKISKKTPSDFLLVRRIGATSDRTKPGWLMARFGWGGVAAFGVVLGCIAGLIHWRGNARQLAEAN